MTPDDVRARIQEIASIGDADPEVAHSKEDELHRDVLAYIGTGLSDDPINLAVAAMETRELDFMRWYA